MGLGLAAMLVLVVILVILALGLVDSLRSRPLKVKHPSCGRCAYAVAGLSFLVCPECGGDLRVVGIVTPAMRFGPRTSAPVGALCWVLLCAIVFLFLSGMARDQGFLAFGFLVMLIGLIIFSTVWLDPDRGAAASSDELEVAEHGEGSGTARPGVDSPA